MVEKRTLIFVTLAVVVWASLASVFAGYYYLQFENSSKQLEEAQNSLSKSASSYDKATNKYNTLLGEYAELYGNYSYYTGDNYTKFLKPFKKSIDKLAENYATLLLTHEDLNKTYLELLGEYETLNQQNNVTKQEFENLLNRYYNLFSLLALKELEKAISESVKLSVNICINYSDKIEWYNETQVPAGTTLFEATQKIANITYTYHSLMEPGHILIDSINEKAAYTDSSYTWGYSWIWYYWDESNGRWVVGPVGCDAWHLRDGGIYKWNYEKWTWP